jgi:hypothetical protein
MHPPHSASEFFQAKLAAVTTEMLGSNSRHHFKFLLTLIRVIHDISQQTIEDRIAPRRSKRQYITTNKI